jgi:MFS family permease
MTQPLSATGRYLILAGAFLGWMFSGVQMTANSLIAGSATTEFAQSGQLSTDHYLDMAKLFTVSSTLPVVSAAALDPNELKNQRSKWYALYNSGFLFGAAAGGLVFGWIGDWLGRVRAMAASILCYSIFAGVGYVAATPEQLLLLRFLCGMGIGGMWPTGVSLAAEAWSDASRPLLSGLLGTSANVGIFLMSYLSYVKPLNAESWRWVMLVGASSTVLGVLVLVLVPESPAWRTAQRGLGTTKQPGVLRSLLTPPLLWLTLIGIALGSIPVLGGWGVTNWFIGWTEAVQGTSNHQARAMTSMMRSGGAMIGGLLGGWIANIVGRRTTYFLISLLSFALCEYIYLFMHPSMGSAFAWAVFLAGGVSTTFYGWLPLYLPELFPTHARATGAGISFNTGRVLSAAGVLGTGALVVLFQNDFRIAGGVMSLIYAMGMVVILLAPDTTGKKLTEA